MPGKAEASSPPARRAGPATSAASTSRESAELDPRPAPFQLLRDLVEEHVERAVRLADGNLSAAAKLLGVGRSTIYRKYRMTGSVRLGEGRLAKRRLAALRADVEVAISRADEDEYRLGLANGMIEARHVMEGRNGTPQYL